MRKVDITKSVTRVCYLLLIELWSVREMMLIKNEENRNPRSIGIYLCTYKHTRQKMCSILCWTQNRAHNLIFFQKSVVRTLNSKIEWSTLLFGANTESSTKHTCNTTLIIENVLKNMSLLHSFQIYYIHILLSILKYVSNLYFYITVKSLSKSQ